VPSSAYAAFSSGVTYTFSSATSGYNIYTITETSTTSETVTFATTPSVDYLVVAGGGGGGAEVFTGTNYGGGGGAGGYRTNNGFGITLGTSYTVTVGGGGTGADRDSNSLVTGTVNTGGAGGGGSHYNNTPPQGRPGGAGGSGVVILRYPDTVTITIGAGLTGTESSASGGYKRATLTAGSGNVSLS
jgi:hypothetical protein